MTDEKAFRCKLCQEEFDDLYSVEGHIETKHLDESIEWLPKSKEPCPYEYYSPTSTFGGPKKCTKLYGHRGDHKYQEPLFAQQFTPIMMTGWRKPNAQ